MFTRVGALLCAVVGSLFLGAVGCGDDAEETDVEARIDRMIDDMTLEERVSQMHGENFFAGGLTSVAGISRLGIPELWATDGPRGVHAGADTTAFPVASLRGATWDPELERRVGRVMGIEAQAQGANILLAPTINILRHPRWGRAQETYGEDPYHMGEMAVGFITGVQETVLACAKHFAANSIEDTRTEVDVTVDERTLREIYLPHFRKAVRDAGVATVMAAYNSVNGLYATENPHLLRDILIDEWGFEGFVMSDWFWAMHSTVDAALAGTHLEMPFADYYGEPLIQAVRDGRVPEELVDDAVRRMIRKKLLHHLDRVVPLDPSKLATPEHVALAREVAEKGIVLLKNDGAALPLTDDLTSIAVVGSLADLENIGDNGSSVVFPPYTVTAMAGIEQRAGAILVGRVPGDTLTADNEAVVAEADAAIVLVGFTAEDEGEALTDTIGGDRDSLALRPEHAALVSAVAALNARTIVVLEGGSAVEHGAWIDDADALLMAWYPGMEGGNALARILFGDVNPSGRLPVAFPMSGDQLPEFDNVSLGVVYGPLHGYRWLDQQQLAPLYPFGFGLSYTEFSYDLLTLDTTSLSAEDTLTAHVVVTNTGAVAGDEVVQLYVSYDGSAVDRAPLELKAFARVSLEPGETRGVDLKVPARELAYFDVDSGQWVIEPLDYGIHVGPNERDLPLADVVAAGP